MAGVTKPATVDTSPKMRNVTSKSVVGVTKPGTVDTTHQIRNMTKQQYMASNIWQQYIYGNNIYMAAIYGKAIEKDLDHGQAYENTFDHGLTNTRKVTVTNQINFRNAAPQTKIQPREKGTGIITRAKEFLEKANKERDKVAEKKLERDRMCTTPGPGYEQNLFIPPHVTFCFICDQYKRQIHYCIETRSYLNIDEKNIIILEGETAAAVEGMSRKSYGRVNRFKTRWDMRTYMWNKGVEISKMRKHRENVKGYTTKWVEDKLTKTSY